MTSSTRAARMVMRPFYITGGTYRVAMGIRVRGAQRALMWLCKYAPGVALDAYSRAGIPAPSIVTNQLVLSASIGREPATRGPHGAA